MLKIFRVLLFLAALLPATRLAAQEHEGKQLTERAFIAETETVEAGKPFYAGFHVKVAEKWHLYWRFAGGPGEPFKIEKWELPKGWRAEELEYPLPHAKHTFFTNYLYDTEVLFPVKITPPEKLGAGPFTLKAKVSWQVCEDICINGEAEMQLVLQAGPAKAANTALFQRWRAELPQTDKPPVGEVKYELQDKALTVRVAGLAQDAKAEVFIIAPKTLRPEFEFEKKPGAEIAPDGTRVYTYPFDKAVPWSGLLVITNADGSRKGWYLSPPPPVEPSKAGKDSEEEVADDGETWDPFAEVAANNGKTEEGDGLWALLLQGFLGGLLLNLMPCVLPVISLKIFGFVKQAGEAKDRIFKLGLAFCAGVFAFFLGLAVLVLILASANEKLGWGAQFSNPIALTVMVAVIFGFGLSLLGVFEVTLGGAEDKLNEASSKKGYGGAFIHGFFTTLLGTSCTAPLVGPVLGVAINQPGGRIFALFAAIATGLALPYFLLTWKPAWMKFLPKPGAWMVRFKQVMGFLMLAFAAWLMSSLPDTITVTAVIYFLLVVGVAAWIYGSYHGSRLALPIALALIVGGWFLCIQGTVQPPEATPSGLNAKVRKALNEGKPVFVDFTADWCANCKVFEATVLNTETIQNAMKEKNVVFVKADYTRQPPDITAALRTMGRVGVPFYMLFRKRGDAWIADGLTTGGLMEELNKL